MQDEWRAIESFPDYKVSREGHIYSEITDRVMRTSINAQGSLKVNLMHENRIYTRNVNHLVAKTYLEPPKRSDFISIIHLDGDKTNCAANNLMWRPRYFTIRYHQQFEHDIFKSSRTPIVDMETGEEYPTIQDVVIRFGLLFNDILISAQNHTFTWPTYQRFQIIDH